jgi:hypothetical protein
MESIVAISPDPTDVKPMRLACEPWRAALDFTCLALCPHQLDQLATVARRFPALRDLDLSNCAMDVESHAELFAHLASLPHCSSLRMPAAVSLPSRGVVTRRNGQPSWYDLPGGWPLPRLPPLAHLAASGITASGLAALSRYAQLSSLQLDGICEPSDGWAASLVEAAPQLASLSIHDSSVCDDDLAELARLRGLTALVLAHAAPVTEAGIRLVAGLAQLQRLRLPGSCTADSGIIHLCTLTRLRQLDLASSCWVTDRCAGAPGCRSRLLAGRCRCSCRSAGAVTAQCPARGAPSRRALCSTSAAGAWPRCRCCPA